MLSTVVRVVENLLDHVWRNADICPWTFHDARGVRARKARHGPRQSVIFASAGNVARTVAVSFSTALLKLPGSQMIVTR